MSEHVPDQPSFLELTADTDPVRVIAFSHYINPQALQSSPFALGHFTQDVLDGKPLTATIFYTPDHGRNYTIQSHIDLPGSRVTGDILDLITEGLADADGRAERFDNHVGAFPLPGAAIGCKVRTQSTPSHSRTISLLVEPWHEGDDVADEALFDYEDADLPVDTVVQAVATTTARIFSLLYQPPKQTNLPKPQFEVSLPGSVLSEAPSKKGAVSMLLKQAGVTRGSHLEYPTFEDFGGIDQHIIRLKEFADQFSITQEEWKSYGLEPSRGILLQGPGGVGKTMLVKALARETGFSLQIFSPSDIMSKWVGEPGKVLKAVFEKAARRVGNQILFFDECDGLFSEHAGGNTGAAQSLIATFKTLLTDKKYSNVIVAMAANSFDKFDPALLRAGRFDTVLKIQKPDENARCSILLQQIDRFSQHFNDLYIPITADGSGDKNDAIDILKLAKITEDFSPADIEALMRGLRYQKLMTSRRTQKDNPIGQSQIERAIREFRQNRPSDI